MNTKGGPVTECYSTGVVSGTSDYIGGLVGCNSDRDVTHCYSTASVSGSSCVGGLIGSNGYEDSGSVIRSYSTGTVSGTGQNVGGLVGDNQYVVLQSFWDVETSGQTVSAHGTGKTTAEMQDPNTFMAAEWDFVGQPDGPHDIWAQHAGGGYPILWWQLSPWPELPRFSGGSGEPDDPYLISTAEQLNSIGYNPRLMTCHFQLGHDLDLTGFRFHPIGWSYSLGMSYPYRGVFDGNGHTVSHLTINGGSFVGLFGQLASGAEVKDLGVVDVNITDSVDNVGALVGSNGSWYSPGGSVTRCYSSGSIGGDSVVGGLVGYDSGKVNQCYSTSAVSGTGHAVGGLVGDNGGIVTNCYSTAAVSGDWSVGGLAGNNYGTVADCYSAGAVSGSAGVGGLLGYSYGTMTRCYSIGAVSGNKDVGGLVGYRQTSPGYGLVTGCFWDTQTSGQATSAAGIGKTTAEMQEIQTYLDAGWDFVGQPDGPHDIWAEHEGGGYPILWWQLSPWPELPRFSGGSGKPDDPYLISTAEQLNSIGHNPRLVTCHFKLVHNLDLTGIRFYPIGDDLPYPYTGVFDGNGHTISHLSIEGERYVGLFGRLDGEVKGLGVVDVNVTSSGHSVGGLVGYNAGDVTNCYSAGTVSSGGSAGGLVGTNWDGDVTDCYSTASVNGGSYVGGLVGNNHGTLIQCYSTGVVSGTDYVGGLVGMHWGDALTRCYSTAAVSGNKDVGGLAGQASYRASVAHCYSTGTVNGNSPAGGLVGSGYPGDVTACFWDTQTSGQVESAGGTGKTTAEMQIASTFLEAGWDFAGETKNGTGDIWWINEGKDYPRLWWELPRIDDR
jgi:hypothetical protein